jgi:hypothetical protein
LNLEQIEIMLNIHDNKENEISVWFTSGIPEDWEGTDRRVFRVNKHITWKKLVDMYNMRGGQRTWDWPGWEMLNIGE